MSSPVPFRSFKEVEAYFSKARSPDKGRPLDKGMLNYRLYKTSDGFRISIAGFDMSYAAQRKLVEDRAALFHVYPNDTIEVANHVYLMRSTWGAANSVHLPFIVITERNRIYIVPKNSRRSMYEVYTGLKFRLPTMQCMNPLPGEESIVPEVRKEWRNNLIAYKKGLLLRAKMGALPATHERIWDDEDIRSRVPLIAEAVRSQDFSVETLDAAYSVLPHNGDFRHFEACTNDLFKRFSLDIRRAYGVFGKRVQQLVLDGKL